MELASTAVLCVLRASAVEQLQFRERDTTYIRNKYEYLRKK
jgi:hypothetical protein